MSRLCRLKTASHGEDGKWAYNEITHLRKQVATLTAQRDMAVEALEVAHSHLEMERLRISHCKHHALIEKALAATKSSGVTK